MKDRRVLLLSVMLFSFMVWLSALFVLFIIALKYIDNLNPVLTLLAGLGVGSITQFFILMLTNAWQFFFRKAGKTQPSAVSPAVPPISS